MQRDTLAPWAEPVPGDDRIWSADEVDDLMDLPDDGWTYELVEGRLVRMPPAGGGNSTRAISLATALFQFVETQGLGRVTGADGEYILSGPGERPTAFAPDVAFVQAGRYPPEESPDYERFWRLAPDLAVEIASPHQYRPAMARKALRYLEAGVRLVWIIWPKYRSVDVWRPGSQQLVATLSEDDTLDGAEVLPGFRYPLRRLFS